MWTPVSQWKVCGRISCLILFSKCFVGVDEICIPLNIFKQMQQIHPYRSLCLVVTLAGVWAECEIETDKHKHNCKSGNFNSNPFVMYLPSVENEMKHWITMSIENEMLQNTIFQYFIFKKHSVSWTFDVNVPKDTIFIVSFDPNTWLCLDRCFYPRFLDRMSWNGNESSH